MSVGIASGWCFSLVQADILEEELDTIAEATVPFGLDTTLDQAQKQSLKRARRLAIEQAVGIIVSSSTVVENFQLKNDLITIVTRGIIVEEKILARGPVTIEHGEGLLYKTKIQAKVRAIRPTKVRKSEAEGRQKQTNLPREDSRKTENASPEQQEGNVQVPKKIESQPPFKDSNLSRGLTQISSLDQNIDKKFELRIRLNKTVFIDGDEVEITVKSASDGYISLFDITQDGHITVLAPNRFLSIIPIQADQEYIFPSSTMLKTRGVKIRAWLPKGITQTTESIKAVVTKDPISFLGQEFKEGIYRQYDPTDTALLQDLILVLSSFQPSEWAEATVSYKIENVP